MFVICDPDNVVQDIASEQANLSLGLSIENHILYSNVTVSGIRIGDTFDGTTLTPNQIKRAGVSAALGAESIIQHKIRHLAIAAAIADQELPEGFIDFYDL